MRAANPKAPVNLSCDASIFLRSLNMSRAPPACAERIGHIAR
jgi:hypothetical protein